MKKAAWALMAPVALVALACCALFPGGEADWPAIQDEVGLWAQDFRDAADLVRDDDPGLADGFDSAAEVLEAGQAAILVYVDSGDPEGVFGWAELVFEVTEPYLADADTSVQAMALLVRSGVRRAAVRAAREAGTDPPAALTETASPPS